MDSPAINRSHDATRVYRMQVSTLVFIACVVFLPSVAEGATASFLCKFFLEATPKGVSKQASPFELRFIVDMNTHKAYLMGNVGSSEVDVIPHPDGVSFVEITESGNVMVTAITNAGDAVHSRNGIMLRELLPSQHYGKCSRQ